MTITFDWERDYAGNLKWLPERTLYITMHGSRSYGTSLPTSDLDIRGIAVAPLHYYLGISSVFEQTVQNEPVDLTIFDIRKFIKLAADANPNALEILFTDPSDHLHVHPLMEKLFEARPHFLSKKAKHTFSGYARAQMMRINTHYRWLKNPPAAPPTRAEFDLPERTVIPADQLAAAQATIQKQIDKWAWHEMEHLDVATRQAMQDEFTRRLLEITQWQEFELDSKVWQAAALTIGLDTNFIRLLDLERRYTGRLREWQHYQDWKKNRNPARAAIEAEHGYDCYAADTEFLTDHGWKTFDEVLPEDQLATVFIRRGVDNDSSMSHRPFLGVEYQKATDRFDALYNGPMYRVSGSHYDCLVTANHRMLFQKEERVSQKTAGWALEEVSNLPDTFNVLVSPVPRNTTYSNKEHFDPIPINPTSYLSLMGWYLSDGCAVFDSDGDGHIKGLRISQQLGGKLSWHMARWHTSNRSMCQDSSLWQYTRDPNSYNPKVHEERVLEVRGLEVGVRIVQECGFKQSKRIPRYVLGLSKCLMEHLLVGLLRGDGTNREHKTKDGSHIYYSKSRELASDVQELAMFCGWETALWGPYENTDVDGRVCLMYQVHLRRGVRSRKFVRSANVERIQVENQRVVCFSVPNGTLVTRRNGKISIHGNCKHAMHLVRLTKMCRELLTDGVVLVRRPDAEELLSIRHGAWTYEQLVEYSNKQDAELNELVLTSTLPKQPNRKKLDELCIELIQAMG